MARREIRTGKIIGWPAVAMGVVVIVFGVAVMIAESVNPLIIVGWAAVGVFVTGALMASRLGYGPRLVNR